VPRNPITFLQSGHEFESVQQVELAKEMGTICQKLAIKGIWVIFVWSVEGLQG